MCLKRALKQTCRGRVELGATNGAVFTLLLLKMPQSVPAPARQQPVQDAREQPIKYAGFFLRAFITFSSRHHVVFCVVELRHGGPGWPGTPARPRSACGRCRRLRKSAFPSLGSVVVPALFVVALPGQWPSQSPVTAGWVQSALIQPHAGRLGRRGGANARGEEPCPPSPATLAYRPRVQS